MACKSTQTEPATTNARKITDWTTVQLVNRRETKEERRVEERADKNNQQLALLVKISTM